MSYTPARNRLHDLNETSTDRGGQRRRHTRATIDVDDRSALVFHDVVRCQTGLFGITVVLAFVASLASGCHKESTTAAPKDTGECDGARCVEMAEAAMYYKDYADAREPLALVCDNKDGFACYRLAELYQFGRGGSVDLDKAATLFEKACEYEHFEGCDKRAELARTGTGTAAIELDYSVKGCEGRRPLACIAAGKQLADGRGIDKDPIKALLMYEKGCDLGDVDGCTGAGDLLSDPKGRPDAKTRALTAYISACVGHSGYGCLKVGVAMHEGIGAPRDDDKARTHFTKACEFNVKDGCDAVKQLDAAKGQNVDLELTTTVAQLAQDGLETRNLSCRMTEYGLPALDKIVASVARHKSTLDACAVDGAAVGIVVEFERGKVQNARIKGKTPGKISKCVKDVLKKLRLANEGKCEAVLLLGNPENAAKGFAARLEAAAEKGDGLNHVHVTEEE